MFPLKGTTKLTKKWCKKGIKDWEFDQLSRDIYWKIQQSWLKNDERKK